MTGQSADDGPPRPREASEHTLAANRRQAASLPLDQLDDFERATRGLLATHRTGQIVNAAGRIVWDIHDHDFLRGEPPPPPPETVNPSLWRQARLNAIHGLFEVVPGIWQVRGYDLSNVTFLAGELGWVVIDPLTSAETARAALDLVHEHLPPRPVSAVIYTHCHVDHFGGVRGVVDEADVAAGRVRIISPAGFLAEAVSENVLVGPVMVRRASYMYGSLLPPGPTGHVDAGLGKATPKGTVGLIAPTEEITATRTELVVDGIRLVFQLTPGTEAPAEMNLHLPDQRVLCMAENCSHNLHNLYTPRGAQVRDALAWSKYIQEAIEWFGGATDVLFASHHWPRWGNQDALDFLEAQRDVYRWIHDQTLRLANHGLTPTEIAEQLDLPPELTATFHVRGYYGTVNHNVKAVYQRYLGWFDGNPANLWRLPPADVGRRYVEALGGADAVLAAGQIALDAGDYRWGAELVNHLVFAEPDNAAARHLQADILEQLGYQAESGPWRNFYLNGARELRHGVPEMGEARPGDLLAALTVEQVFDSLGVRLNGPLASGKRITVNWRFTDLGQPGQPGEDHVLGLRHGALHHVAGRWAPPGEADATVTLTRTALLQTLGGAPLAAKMASGEIRVEGNAGILVELFGCLDTFKRGFAIVTP